MGHALKTFGYNLSDQFIRVLVQKFDKYGKYKAGLEVFGYINE